MSTLEARLGALADTAFPPTPDLTGSWAAKSTHEVQKAARGWRGGALALAGAVVLAGGAAVTATQLSGPQDVEITRVDSLPSLPIPSRPDLGVEVGTLEEASTRAGFAVRAHATPNAIHVDRFGVVTLTYDDVVISQARGIGLEKVVGPETKVRVLRVGGARAVFFTGGPRRFHFPEARLTSSPTLVVQTGELVLRIEGAPLERARQIATALLRSPAP